MSAAVWVSPRSAERPMAFTYGELARGALIAWGAFVVLLLIAFFVPTLMIPGALTGQYVLSSLLVMTSVIIIYGGLFSFVAMLVGSPLAWLIARTLTRVRAIPVHVAIFFLLGAVIGVLAILVLGLVFPNSVDGIQWPISALIIVPAALAVPFGWWRSARRALRKDRGAHRPRVTNADPDALYEDAL